VIPLSPPNKRTFLYNETYKHNSLDVKEFTTKTREIQLLTRSSPTRVPSSLRTGDIDRSSPARRCPVEPIRRWYDQSGKCGSLTTQDIAGAQPVHRNIAKRNKPDRMTFVNDIHGASPNAHTALSKRMVDPLAPSYVLPSCVQAPAPYMPPARPFNTTAGIDGAQSLVKYMRWKQRQSSFLVNDVDGASVPKRRLYKDRRNPLDVSDINNDPEGAGHVFHTNRLTNVLDPRYVWDVPSGAQNWTIGDIGDDKPAPQMNARDAPRRLHSKQMPAKGSIAGSQTMMLHEMQLGKAVAGFDYLGQPRKEVRNTNHIADIKGAAADSVRPGMTTNRITDPLKPDYIWPGLSADIGSAAYCPTPELVASPMVDDFTPLPTPTPPPIVITKAESELHESLMKVKEVFHQRGAYAGRALARVIRNFDDGDGNINKQELELGLRNYLGFEMDEQDFEHVWRYFDEDNSGAITIAEFLYGIRGNLNKTRLNAVIEAYEKIDRDSSGLISLNEIEALYDVSNHPKVLSGEWSRREALTDFLKQWDADNSAEVTKEEFLDYFKDVSLGMPDDEDFLRAMHHIFPSIAPPGQAFESPPRKSSPQKAASPASQRRSSAGHTPDSASLSAGRLERAKRRKEQLEVEEKAMDVKTFTLRD